MSERPVKDRLICAIEGVIIVNAALVYSVAGLAPQTLVGVVVGVSLAIAIGQPLPHSSRTVVYGAVATLLLATLESQIFQTRETRLFLPQSSVYCPLLLYGATILLFYAQGRLIPPLITSAGLLVMLLAGSTLGNPPIDHLFPLQSQIAGNFTSFYRLATVVQILAMVALFHRQTGRREKTPVGGALARRGLVLAALALVFFTSMAAEKVATSFEPNVNRWYSRFMNLYLRGRVRRVMFDSQVDLWRTADVRAAKDRTVVLRVVSPSRPGYFRGRIYDTYQRGRWSGERQTSRLPAWPADGFKAYTIFNRPLPAVEFEPESLSVFTDVALQTDVLFVPGTASRFEIVAASLSNDPAGMITQNQWEQRAGYRVVRQKASGSAAYPMPRGETVDFSPWLEVPESLHRGLAPFAQAAFSPAPQSDAERMREAVAFLNAHCQYELGTRIERFRHRRRDPLPIDPLLQFLAINRKGHCELFATAAAMLLRRQGVPARYVTGFICAEMASGYWVARLEHAHAWVEAYDGQREKWVLVEATPASGLPSQQPQFGWWSGLADWLRMGWRQIMAMVRRGEFAAIIAWLAVAIWQRGMGLLRSPWSWTLLAIAGLSCLTCARRRRRRRWQTNPQLAILNDLLAGVERAIGRKNLHRKDAETLCEFRQRLRGSTPAAEPLCVWLEEYEALRYNPQARTPLALAALQEHRRHLRLRRSQTPFRTGAR